ncbi:Ig-like domain-containing protein [Salinivirga cyanobacteriivorans]|nr:Ig-like domain-containing protein [Salinivirga cyanobacteriivorans]
MRRFFIYSVFYVLLLILYGCAKEAAPTGGPKDFDPPVVIEEKPPNYTTNFSENKVKIYFNEFVKLENLREELLISPPFEELPKMIVKGKRLVINLPDSLPEQKTVNLSFYNAIVDVNEANVLKNYQYVFSTSDQIDTSFIDGRLIDAETGKPLANELVYAYESFEDSIVSKTLPDYIARTNKQGIFVINNLGDGPYKLFSLKDRNRNNLYDQPTEGTAFLNDSILPAIEWTTITDTIKLIDSIMVEKADTTYRDSVYEQRVQVSKLKPFQLRMFVKDYKKHYLTYSGRPRKGQIALSFNRSIAGFDYNFELLSPGPSTDQWYKEEKLTNDSLLLWIKDLKIYESDTIHSVITYPFTDSAGKVVQKSDTVYLNYDFSELQKNDTILTINGNLRRNKLDIDSTFRIGFSEPLKSVDESKIQFLINLDTAYTPYDFNFDLLPSKREARVLFKQDLYGKYRIIMDSAAFLGIHSNTNDSSVITFQYFEKADYGNLVLNVDTLPDKAVFLLYTKDEELYAKQKNIVKKPVEFRQLPPGNYYVRVLMDDNQNGKWDTGDYYKKEFPELVIAFPSKLIIKANWDTEQNWELSKTLKLYK